MKLRSEIDPKDTWDLTKLYPHSEAYLKDLASISHMGDQLAAYKGKLAASAKNLYEALTLNDKMGTTVERAAAYARLGFDSDMGDPKSKDLYERLDYLFSGLGEKLAFFEPELLEMEPETFEKYKTEEPGLKLYSWMMTRLFRQKGHVLSAREEELLTRMATVAGSFDKIFDDLTVNDIVYPTVQDSEGNPLVANEANYRKAMESEDRQLRRRYYDALLGTYKQHVNTIASTLAGNTRYHVLAAKSRNYASSLEQALAPNNIPISVYENLISTLRSELGPLQDYLVFRRQTLGYDDLHFYDLFVPLVKGKNRSYTFLEAKDIVLDAVTPLGEEYQKTMARAFSERWIDIYPNKGKATGAYATGVYGVHPYSLLNFTGTLDDLSTIIHELGHAMHSYYSDTNQPFVNAAYCIFTAEVASTVNENLLFHYLLERARTPEEKAYLLCSHLDGIRSTLYRQGFFADFERSMHQLIEADEPMVPQVLCRSYQKLYELYHGPDFVVDESLTYEWARIPHFYRPFYVYQYATGISAAISLARGILKEGEPKVKAYLAFLKSGGSNDPIELLKGAGVDLSTTAPITAAVEDFRETLTELKKVMKQVK
ncbi:MAG: oligoendopeptidase F [Peptococcaceae bacterium]|nr:oligoendopeptidase F [Peptococcaceae bacterium]